MIEYDFEITSTEQLDEFQYFHHPKGLCMVLSVICEFDSYECESECGEVFYLQIGDKISLN